MQRKCICVTGATGFIGSAIVADLLNNGYKVRALVREIPIAEQQLKNVDYFPYEQLDSALRNAYACLHFAAKNNDAVSTEKEFIKDNFELTKELIVAADKSGVEKFIFASSTKALSHKSNDWYSQSKLKSENWIEEAFSGNMQICTLRLPPVYGPNTKNKLSKLEPLPQPLRSFTLNQLRALTPIVSVSEVSVSVRDLISNKNLPRELMLSSPLTCSSSYWLFYFLINAAFVVLCILLLPVLIAISGIVFATSKGPVLFLQKRIGKNTVPYTCIKFRTMAQGTKQQGTHLVSASSVTKIGSFLRKSKIDELPQAINIATGKMSLIGPRPCLLNQQEVIDERNLLDAYKITPGISGLAQVSDIDMSTPKKLATYDQRYCASRSIITDCKIILQTITGRGQGDLVR